MTLGKNISFKETNPVFFFPLLLSKKPPHPCTAPKGDVCPCLWHSCSVSIPPAPRLAKMQMFFSSFFTQVLESSGGLGRLLGGAGKSGCKQSPDFLPCFEVSRACLECHNPAPAVEPLDGVSTGGLIPHPFLFPLCWGRKGDSAEEKGGSSPKLWSCFLSERNKTFC